MEEDVGIRGIDARRAVEGGGAGKCIALDGKGTSAANVAPL